jgi:Flp pilus assembly protein TadD
MSAQHEDALRRLIPRWRYVQGSSVPAETIADHQEVSKDRFDNLYWEKRLRAWGENPTVGSAADLVACGVALRRYAEVEQPALFLTTHAAEIRRETASLAIFAELQLHPQRAVHVQSTSESRQIAPDQEAQMRVSQNRARLRDDPRDSLAWMDMALAYTILGQTLSAERAMQRALMLAGDNRLILRSACRRLVHIGDTGAAHRLLASHPRTPQDPWLLAAEIALADIIGKPSKLTRRALGLLESKRFLSSATTELSGALGMLEYSHGSDRKARQLIRQSLILPTENSVAQARWVAARMTGIDISASAWDTPRSFEAWSWRAFNAAEWFDAYGYAKAWVRDEPYSSRAAINATFIAETIFDDHTYAIACADQVLRADANDMMLRNNLVVALAREGEVGRATQEFETLQKRVSAASPESTYVATHGLIKYRNGDIEAGRALYQEALESAPSNRKLAVLTHWLREEIDSRRFNATETIEKLQNIAQSQKDLVSLRLLENMKVRSSSDPHQEAIRILDSAMNRSLITR